MITYANKLDAVTPNGVPIPGSVFYVNSATGNNNNSGSKRSPKASLTGALSDCVDNRGDYIYIMPGHTSTVPTAGMAVNKAGVSIIGLGNGAKRPTFTWSATDSVLTISAANVTIQNIITTISVDEVVSMILVSGANVTLDTVDFVPYGALGATGQAIQWLLTTTAADGICVKNCTHMQKTAANANQVWMDLNGVDYPRIMNNHVQMTAKAATASHWIGTTAACNEVYIARNHVNFLGGTVTGIITCATGTTGIIADNYLGGGAQAAWATSNVVDTAYQFNNLVSNEVAKSGGVNPAADTA